MDRDYVPDDYVVVRAIKKAFRTVDQDVLNEAAQRVVSGEGDLAHTVAMIAPAVAGSCALLALFDPARGVLRVANTGDSRAVLGRWDEGEGRYVAKAMSVDQTGFNEEEVERLGREHPDEEGVVDPKTGRVLGIAVSRAFGDARWKWSDEMTRTVYEKFWGPAPRPNGVVKTPPYLTAEPEVMEAKVETGEHPDFLIMATDGLWDNISSEDAVTCVQQWLDKYNPTGFFDNKSVVSSMDSIKGPKFNRKGKPQNQQAYKPDFTSDPNEDEETYWNETEKSMKWKVSPKHFVVEDENCGMHLVKNALGGKRRNLFRGVMSVQVSLWHYAYWADFEVLGANLRLATV
jgi:pyruvate dehydrogenase phosphatase